MVHLEPLADWCSADYLEKRVTKIDAVKNTIHFEDGGELAYDVLGVNIGSRTRGVNDIPGVFSNSLTTRPINDLLGKIEAKEKFLLEQGITPTIAVCGSGAAGIELSFAFKNRWSRTFKKNVKTYLLCTENDIMRHESEAARELTKAKLKEHDVEVVHNARIKRVDEDQVVLQDGRKIQCNVPVWATGAEPQQVTVRSNLAVLDGYFRVNDFL
jgi:NADH dehydrogenase FAD-containing subunit